MSIFSVGAPPKLDCCDRQVILDYFHNAWQLEEILLKTLIEDETFYTNPDPLRNFLIFYLGHSAVFYINKLICVGLLQYFGQFFQRRYKPYRAIALANIYLIGC